MNQKPIVRYLARKGLTAVLIHHDLVATLGAEAISYQLSAIHLLGTLREARSATSNPEPAFSELDIEPDDCDEAILLILHEQPFASIHQLARLIHIPRSIVYRLFTLSWTLANTLIFIKDATGKMLAQRRNPR
jgi:hypothetical protein